MKNTWGPSARGFRKTSEFFCLSCKLRYLWIPRTPRSSTQSHCAVGGTSLETWPDNGNRLWEQLLAGRDSQRPEHGSEVRMVDCKSVAFQEPKGPEPGRWLPLQKPGPQTDVCRGPWLSNLNTCSIAHPQG